MARIIPAHNTLDDHRKRGLADEPLEIDPAQRRIRVGVDVLGERIRPRGGRPAPPAAEIGVMDTPRQAERIFYVAVPPAGLGRGPPPHKDGGAGPGGGLESTRRP